MVRFSSLAVLSACSLTTVVRGVKVVASEREFDDAIDNFPGRLVVVNFDTPTCGESCEVMRRPFLDFSRAHSANAEFVTINAQKAFDVFLAAGVVAVPTIRFYLDGLQIGHLQGPEEAEMLPQTFKAAAELARPCDPVAKAASCADPVEATPALPEAKPRLTTVALPEAAARPATAVASAGVVKRTSATQPATTVAAAGIVKRAQATEVAKAVAANAQSHAERTKGLEYMRAQALAQAQATAHWHAQAQGHASMIRSIAQPRMTPCAVHSQQHVPRVVLAHPSSHVQRAPLPTLGLHPAHMYSQQSLPR